MFWGLRKLSEKSLGPEAPSVDGIPISRHWLIPQENRPKVYSPHPVMSPDEIRQRSPAQLIDGGGRDKFDKGRIGGLDEHAGVCQHEGIRHGLDHAHHLARRGFGGAGSAHHKRHQGKVT